MLLLFCTSVSAAQQKPGNTYAIVVGVSSYEHPAIPSLQFAHRDAQEFAAYLQTKAGGNVPLSHIRLLVNEEATTAAVYAAMQWVLTVATENDRVYFYFAGHGDMENTTIYKLGFLLTYNTPANNYINNSIRMEDVNNFANTLSAGKKVKVIMITDACHSGKLAGTGYRGNLLVGNQLRTSVANEIRITSCSPEQLSNENVGWGGGRGVFSFYLINGLVGYADRFPDGIVRLQEVKSYVDSAMQNDPLLKSNNVVQVPVIPITPTTQDLPLSVVDTIQMQEKKASNQIHAATVVPNDAALPPELLLADVFNLLKKEDVAEFDSIQRMLALETTQLPSFFLRMYLKYLNKELEREYELMNGNVFHGSGTFLQNKRDIRINELENQHKKAERLLEYVETSPQLAAAVNYELVFLLHTQTQQVINDYLEGSEAELERRRYYNASSNGYDAYPLLLQLAMNLTDKHNFLYHAMEVNRYYFSAIALLVKIPVTADKSPLVREAFQLLTRALEIEKGAAYIYNALGTVYLHLNDWLQAEKNFLKATRITPAWALPYSNLMLLYIQKQHYTKAMAMYDTAFALQPSLQSLSANRAMLAEAQQNLLLAEELYQKSIALNSRHYYPFERLGVVYTKTTNYALADSFFFEADLRKKGFHLKPFLWTLMVEPMVLPNLQTGLCDFDTLTIQKNDVLGYFAWGMQYYLRNDFKNAAIKWKQVIALDKRNPLVFHYLGLMSYEQQQWAETDLLLNFAVTYYADPSALEQHARYLKQFSTGPDSACFYSAFLNFRYNQTEDHYLLANLYEQWHHFTQAEVQYRKLMTLTPGFIGPYAKLWMMLERLGRFTDAEDVLLQYRLLDKEEGDKQLNAFYKRVTGQQPDNGYWHLKAGLFLYQFAVNAGNEFELDKKAIFPDQQQPEEAVPVTFTMPGKRNPEVLPGTNDKVEYADAVLKPYSGGIRYLLKADSLLGSNDEVSADINDKIGDLYVWQGVPAYAAVHYQKSVDLVARNSGVRLKLIDQYDRLYQFSNALVHLDSLEKRKELNFDKLVLLAKYCIHRSLFTEAKQKLDSASLIYPYQYPPLMDLYGRSFLLSNQPQKAIEAYKRYLQLQPDDASVMYSISRAYSQLKNKAKALEWLDAALQNGFNYGWVLQHDPAMDLLRSSSRFKKMLSSNTFKGYPSPANTYQRKEQAK